MKKVLFLAFAITICLTGCKKDERQLRSGSCTQNGTLSAITVTLPNNLIDDEYVSAEMPQSSILGAFRMTYDEFMEAWNTGTMVFGSSDNCTPPIYEWNNSTVSGSWGHWFDGDGNVCASDDSDAAFCIMGVRDATTGTDSPFQYIVHPTAGYEQFTGTTVSCLQAFKYTDGERTETIAVPWSIQIKKGDPRVLGIKKSMYGLTYDKGSDYVYTGIANHVFVKQTIGIEATEATTYAYVNGTVTSVKGDTLYFAVDGTTASRENAALVFYKDQSYRDWFIRMTENEASEGQSIRFGVAFVNEKNSQAAVYDILFDAKERVFAEMKGTFSMQTGIVFQGKMLSTTRQREYTFDLPSDVYTTLEYLVAQRGQSGLTLATLISRGFVTVNGPLSSLEESTATPYGHWFDSNAKVCKEGSADAYSCFVLTPDLTTGHCLVTLKNVPGANKTGDSKTFQQTLHSTVLGLDIPITYIVSVE